MSIWFRRCASFDEEAVADREYWRQFTPDERVAQIEDLRSDWPEMSDESSRPTSDHADFLGCLTRHNVRALVVGAHALAFHAKPRYTRDLDILVEASESNGRSIVAALEEFGFGGLGLTEFDFAVPGRVVQRGVPPNRIDIMTRIDGITFEEAWKGRVEGTFAGQRVAFIGKAELIRNKTASARSQDLADLDLLRRS